MLLAAITIRPILAVASKMRWSCAAAIWVTPAVVSGAAAEYSTRKYRKRRSIPPATWSGHQFYIMAVYKRNSIWLWRQRRGSFSLKSTWEGGCVYALAFAWLPWLAESTFNTMAQATYRVLTPRISLTSLFYDIATMSTRCFRRRPIAIWELMGETLSRPNQVPLSDEIQIGEDWIKWATNDGSCKAIVIDAMEKARRRLD